MEKKCTRLPALTAERNVTFHSNQTAPGQFTAESATQNEDPHADIKIGISGLFCFQNYLSFFFVSSFHPGKRFLFRSAILDLNSRRRKVLF